MSKRTTARNKSASKFLVTEVYESFKNETIKNKEILSVLFFSMKDGLLPLNDSVKNVVEKVKQKCNVITEVQIEKKVRKIHHEYQTALQHINVVKGRSKEQRKYLKSLLEKDFIAPAPSNSNEPVYTDLENALETITINK